MNGNIQTKIEWFTERFEYYWDKFFDYLKSNNKPLTSAIKIKPYINDLDTYLKSTPSVTNLFSRANHDTFEKTFFYNFDWYKFSIWVENEIQDELKEFHEFLRIAEKENMIINNDYEW